MNDNVVLPYRMLEHVERLEVEFWENGSSTNGLIHSMSCLQNWFYYLYTLQLTVLGESMWFATLSDMWNFTVHPPMEPHAYEIFCMLIRIGKANQAGLGKTLLGRVLRHKNVLMYGYGAFGLYMLCRFMVTKEDKTIDLTKVDNWFKIKLMVGGDANATNNKTAVSDRRFDKAIRQHQKSLGINSCHKLHFGRAEMPPLLELMEVDPDYIRSLGNWDQHAYDKAYSGKMPLPSMRGYGGHATEKGLHFNIRGQVDLAKELEKQLFTFVEREDAKIRALPNYHTMSRDITNHNHHQRQRASKIPYRLIPARAIIINMINNAIVLLFSASVSMTAALVPSKVQNREASTIPYNSLTVRPPITQRHRLSRLHV